MDLEYQTSSRKTDWIGFYIIEFHSKRTVQAKKSTKNQYCYSLVYVRTSYPLDFIANLNDKNFHINDLCIIIIKLCQFQWK